MKFNEALDIVNEGKFARAVAPFVLGAALAGGSAKATPYQNPIDLVKMAEDEERISKSDAKKTIMNLYYDDDDFRKKCNISVDGGRRVITKPSFDHIVKTAIKLQKKSMTALKITKIYQAAYDKKVEKK